MKIVTSWARLILSLLLLSAISACGNSAAIQSTRRIQADFPKTRELVFIYQAHGLKAVPVRGNGIPHSVGETGYNEFGPILAGEARNAFALQHVDVLKSTSIDATDAVMSENTLGADLTAGPVLLIRGEPGGSILSDLHYATIKIQFTASLIDTRTKKAVWTASIDTRTIAGSNSLRNAMAGGRFDQKFAVTLLQKVATAMKADGVI